MAKEKIMISGAMSSDPIRNRGHFHAAATMLRTVNTAVLNPAALPEGLSEPEYMQICLAFVQVADTIYMLDGWEQSLGARAEHALAQKLDLKIVYQNGEALDLSIAQLA